MLRTPVRKRDPHPVTSLRSQSTRWVPFFFGLKMLRPPAIWRGLAGAKNRAPNWSFGLAVLGRVGNGILRLVASGWNPQC